MHRNADEHLSCPVTMSYFLHVIRSFLLFLLDLFGRCWVIISSLSITFMYSLFISCYCRSTTNIILVTHNWSFLSLCFSGINYLVLSVRLIRGPRGYLTTVVAQHSLYISLVYLFTHLPRRLFSLFISITPVSLDFLLSSGLHGPRTDISQSINQFIRSFNSAIPDDIEWLSKSFNNYSIAHRMTVSQTAVVRDNMA